MEFLTTDNNGSNVSISLYYDEKKVHEEFIKACRKGKLEKAQNIHNILSNKSISQKLVSWIRGSSPKLSSTYYEAFACSCENGHVKTAKWLNTLPIINQGNRVCALHRTCRSRTEHITIVKMLYRLVKSETKIYGQILTRAFDNACYNGHMQSVVYLYESGINLNYDDFDDVLIPNRVGQYRPNQKSYTAIVSACDGNQIEIIKWLREIGADTKNKNAFVLASHDHFKIANWLYTVHPDLLTETLFDLPSEFLERIGLDPYSITIVESIRNSDILPDIKEINECRLPFNEVIIHALGYYNKTKLLDDLSEIFPISYMSNGTTTECSLNWNQTKNARKVI